MPVDLPGYVTDLKEHATEHGFHVHDERHFVETYSLRQAWEVDLHPEEACGGPLDIHLALEVDPRVLLSFEDLVMELDEGDDPPDLHRFPLHFSWSLPPLAHTPDLLVLATDLAGIGGTDLPLEVSAIDSFASVTDAAERSVGIVGRVEVSLSEVYMGERDIERPHERGRLRESRVSVVGRQADLPVVTRLACRRARSAHQREPRELIPSRDSRRRQQHAS